MIEAKDKEQAVMELHRIYELQPTVHENLRPPVDVETLRTQGRKSSKKKKVKAADSDEAEEMDDVDPEEVLVDIDGAEVLPPVELNVGQLIKAPAKTKAKAKAKAQATKNGEATTPTPTPVKKDMKIKTPRKSRAKKVKTEEGNESIKDQVKAEPFEAQPIEVCTNAQL